MNPTTTDAVRESEYVLRRLGESFSQFRADLWESVPLPLLVLAAAAVVARVWYAAYYRKTHPHAKPDAAVFWLGWAAAGAVLFFVVWTLVAYYKADTAQTKSGVSSLSSLGQDNATLWWAFVGGVFGLGALFVVWMYVRDARSVRWYWAAKLSLVRIAVYALLLFVFLLPARQTWERTEKRSRVVVLLDISPSMTKVSDDVARKGLKQKTRMEVLIELLTDRDVALLRDILKKNPVAVYSFGTRLDEAPRLIPAIPPDAALSPWGAADWAAVAAYDFRPLLAQGLSEAGRAQLEGTTQPSWAGPKPPAGTDKLDPTDWAAWAKVWTDRKAERVLVTGMSDEDTKALRENLERLERRIDVARTIATGTNVPDSVTDALNRESPNMVQGVLVFSDMRSNADSEAQYRELKAAAERASIPVFTIAVGEDRRNTSIAITDIQVDDNVSPDEGGRVAVGVDGTNLAGQTVPVELDVFLPGRDPKDPAAKPNYTFRDSRADKTKGVPTPYTVTFAPGDPPHGSVEIVIKPDQLAADPDPDARALVVEDDKGAFKKWALREGTWTFRARVPRDENESFPDEFHVRERGGVQVLPKKVRVLAIAAAPTKEFHFFRTFMNREVGENRATFAILLQNEAGRSGNFTPNAGEKLLLKWPLKLDVSGKADAPKVDPKAGGDAKADPNVDPRPYNLNEYDVIVAFDPDWNGPDLNDPLVSKQQAEDLGAWVERQGGGLILVADRINTYQLARVERGSRLDPVLEVLPVQPDDAIANQIRRISRHPRRLYLSPMPGSDLLKIDDPPAPEKKDGAGPPDDPVAGWERFFTGRDRYEPNRDEKVELFPRYGFYSAYPTRKNEVKPGAKVLAELADVDENGGRLLRPWLVVSNPSAGFRTCYLASGELYRFHQYDPVVGKDYYDRFWAKLLRYMAAKRNVKAARGRVLTSKEVQSGDPVRVTAQLLDAGSKPYAPGAIDAKFSVVRTGPDGAVLGREGPFELAPAGVDGYFKGQVTADPRRFPVGDFQYTVEVDVPDSPGDKLSAGFGVTKADREMKDAAPNFAAGVGMASPFNEAFQGRVSPSVRDALKAGLPKEAGVPKLAFRLADKQLIKLIPDCFKTVPSRTDVRGPVEDLWDEKVLLFDVSDPDWKDRLGRWGFRPLGETERGATPVVDFFRNGPRMFRWGPEDPPARPAATAATADRPVQVAVSWVVLVVVLLLGWEWLTRKLLRLA